MHPISVLTKNKNYQREDNLMSLIFLTRTKEINKGQNVLLLCICNFLFNPLAPNILPKNAFKVDSAIFWSLSAQNSPLLVCHAGHARQLFVTLRVLNKNMP